MASADMFMLNKDKSVLVIVDIQQRLTPAMSHKDQVITNCQHLIEAAKLLEIPTLLTEQYPKGLGSTEDGIKDALQNIEAIEKITFSCCGEPNFTQALKRTGRTQVILVGMETHVCVLQTCLELLRDGYDVHMVQNAVCSRKKSDYLTGIELARDAGAVITSTEIALFQLLYQAGTPEFKTISKRIR